MSKTIALKLQHWTHCSPAALAGARSNPTALAELLESPKGRRVSLGMYWHAVAYLIEGIPKNLDEPFCWFIEGGETIGRNDAGDVRYLTPAQVASLARALRKEEPDELGYDGWDEARMDALGIHPRRWAVLGQDTDHLGTVRELFSYVRSHIADASRKKVGMIIHLTDEPMEVDRAAKTESGRRVASVPVPAGELVLEGEGGRTYYRADATGHKHATPKVLSNGDSAMARAGLKWIGDFSPGNSPRDTIRTYLSEDRTIVAIFYLSDYAVGGVQLFCQLDGDALVTASNAFVTEVKKRRYFADFLQNVDPSTLHTALLARREKLAKKHGKPMVQEHTLKACVSVWESQFVRLNVRR